MSPPAGQWKTGLYDCCEQPGGCGNCCYAIYCTSCAYGSNVQQLSKEEDCCGGSCCGACCAHTALGGIFPLAAGIITVGLGAFITAFLPISFGWCIHMRTRKAIRNKYNLPEEPCNDCLVTACCTPCAVTQEYREIQLRKQEASVQQAVAAAQYNAAPQAVGTPAVYQP